MMVLVGGALVLASACGDDETTKATTTNTTTTASGGNGGNGGDGGGGNGTGGACALADTTAPTTCEEACAAVYDCGSLACGGCEWDGSDAEQALFVGDDMSGCIAGCNDQMALIGLVDPADCAGTIEQLTALSPDLDAACTNGISGGGGAGGTGGAGGAGGGG
jgi:hypothetical protein